MDNYGEEAYIRYVLDNMRLSKNKIEAINNSVPLDERMYYYFPILKYHNRYAELTEDDYNYKLTFDTTINGFDAGNNKFGADLVSNQESTYVGELPYNSELYLNKIIELSRTNNFNLVLVNAPYDYTSNDSISNWYKDDAALYNKISEIADENNIPFINYSTIDKMNDIDFDFKEDMNNIGHVNIWGANKVSLDFADFLNNNYTLKDRRTE